MKHNLFWVSSVLSVPGLPYLTFFLGGGSLFETGSHYIPPDGFELGVVLPVICLSNDGMTGMKHQT